MKTCETKESQKWRHASNQETAKRLTHYHNCLPELSNLHSVLESYSICERHYNQIIVTNHFIDILQVLSKRINDCNADEDDVTDHANPSLAVQLDRTRKIPESSQLENEQKLRLVVADFTQQVEDHGKEIVDLKARLQILLTFMLYYH